MEKIFSRVNPEILLHVIHKKEHFSGKRVDFSTDREYIQPAAMVLSKGDEVSAHKHIKGEKIGDMTQEAVIVIEGGLEVKYYDINDNLIKTEILKSGDCSVTYFGGHSFKVLTENTKIYEIKNGPYLGKEKDKVKI